MRGYVYIAPRAVPWKCLAAAPAKHALAAFCPKRRQPDGAAGAVRSWDTVYAPQACYRHTPAPYSFMLVRCPPRRHIADTGPASAPRATVVATYPLTPTLSTPSRSRAARPVLRCGPTATTADPPNPKP
eukprot:scaffold59389_cov72-Phaeocystis_antarctica.AAC.1